MAYIKKYRRTILIILLFVGMAFSGLLSGLRSVALPLIKAEFGSGYDEQGVLVLLSTAAGAVSAYLGGIVYKKRGTKVCMLLAFFVAALLCLMLGIAPSYGIVLGGIVLIRFSYNFYELGKNAVSQWVFLKKIAARMTILHCMYGLGNVLGPKLAQWLIASVGLTWRQVFLWMLVPAGIIFAVCMIVDFTESGEGERKTETAGITLMEALKMKQVWVYALLATMSGIVEDSFGNWSLLYLQDVYALDPITFGATFIAVFYVLFTASRLFLGPAIERVGYIRTLWISTLAVIVLMLLGFVLGRQGIWLLPVTGLFIALYIPTQLATVLDTYGEHGAMMITAATIISCILMSGGQYLIGLVSDWLGDAWGFRSVILYAVAFCVLLVVYSRNLKRDKQKTQLSA